MTGEILGMSTRQDYDPVGAPYTPPRYSGCMVALLLLANLQLLAFTVPAVVLALSWNKVERRLDEVVQQGRQKLQEELTDRVQQERAKIEARLTEVIERERAKVEKAVQEMLDKDAEKRAKSSGRQ